MGGISSAQRAWSHPSYKSYVLQDPFPNSLHKQIVGVVPVEVLPSGCKDQGEVVSCISKSDFWDDIMYSNMSNATLHKLNTSMVGSPRQRNYSRLIDTRVDADGGVWHTMYSYPRPYVPCSDFRMSPMPGALMHMCNEAYRLLYDDLTIESRNFGPFNCVQVRGYYEAFHPHTGEHCDNGQLDSSGLVAGGRLRPQCPNSAVAIYMIGDCPMDFNFIPTLDARQPATIKLKDGMLMLLHPHDDCRCKHSLKLSISSKEIQFQRYRISFVMRQLHVVREYHSISRMLKLNIVETQHLMLQHAQKSRQKARLRTRLRRLGLKSA